jgi:Dolichyl-phosphate-mannose-protein mannosyltransferase
MVGRSFTALAPDPSDAQLFAYFGLQWLDGYIPYVNIWDNKPPGIFAVNALVFLLFPKSFTALAWMEGVFILGCIATIYLLMRQWGGPWLVAALATASVAVTSNLLYYNQHGNYTELYMLWPAALSMYCFSKASPTFQGKWIFLAGFFSGVASLFKPPGLSPMLAQAVFLCLLWAAFRRLSLPRMLAAGFVTSVGALAAWLPAASYFWRHNAFGELVYAAWTFNIYYGAASQTTILSAAFDALSRLQLLASLVVCAIVGLIPYIRLVTSGRSLGPEDKRGQTPCFWWPLALLWVVFDLAGALAGGRNYPHYFLPLAASLSVVAGLTYWFLVESIPNQPGWWGLDKALFALIVGPLIFAQVLDVRQMLSWARGSSERPAVKSREAVATHLNAIRSPSDTLFTWDYLPRIYFATEMKSPMRLLDAQHIFDSAQAHRRFGEEIVRGLNRTPPTFMVEGWRRADREHLGIGDPVYRKFQEFLETNYVRIYTFDNLRLYRHQTRSKVIGE